MALIGQTSVNQRTYAAGDSFTRQIAINAPQGVTPEEIFVDFTVAGWASMPGLITGTLMWDTGAGRTFSIDSPAVDRMGAPLSVVRVRVGVHRVADPATGLPVKANMTRGEITVRFNGACTTAISGGVSDAPMASTGRR
jgi:hypothetical protein